jgi:predicted Zn-dependent protease
MTARLRILSWLLRRGKRLLQVQQWHASRGCFEQMLRLSEPGSRPWRLARVYLARIAERFGNREEARGHIRQLLRCQPGEARWHYRLGRLWRKEQRPDCWQRALRHLRLAVKRSPGRAAYWAELGRCLADAGKPRLALRYLHRAWSLAPHSLRYLAWLLELLLACDRFAEAERLVQQARLLHRDKAAIGDLRRRCQLHILLAPSTVAVCFAGHPAIPSPQRSIFSHHREARYIDPESAQPGTTLRTGNYPHGFTAIGAARATASARLISLGERTFLSAAAESAHGGTRRPVRPKQATFQAWLVSNASISSAACRSPSWRALAMPRCNTASASCTCPSRNNSLPN